MSTVTQTTKSKDSTEFDIDDLIELPRPGSALPNPSGSYALWPSSTFTFDKGGRTQKSIYAIDLKRNANGSAVEPREVLSSLVYNEVAWLDDRAFVFLRPAMPEDESPKVNSRGEREDHPSDLSDQDQQKRLQTLKAKAEGVELWAKDVLSGVEYHIASFPVGISNLQAINTSTDKTDGALLSFNAKVFPDGDLFSVSKQKKMQQEQSRGSDVQVYDSLWVRHWDEWSSTAGEKTQIFHVRLTRNPESLDGDASEPEGFTQVISPSSKWRVVNSQGTDLSTSSKGLTVLAPMARTQLEGTEFSTSRTHLVFQAKDPLLNKAWHTRTQVYLVPHDPKNAEDAEPKAITVGSQGACSSPSFSADGKRIAWLEMREDGYEADRNRVMIYEVETGVRWGATEDWDRSPSQVLWCPCGEKIFLVTEDGGYGKLFQLGVPKPSSIDASFKRTMPEPHKLTHRHSVAAAEPLSTSSLLLTTNSFVGPNRLSILEISAPQKDESDEKDDNPDRPPVTKLTPLASLTDDLVAKHGLDEGESFWFAGAEGIEVHGWILFPPELQGGAEARAKLLEDGKAKKKYPLAFLVHGGPQGAWTDGWSTRWNPNIYASHGYITVAINPTGSTGYGQEFCDRIKNQWGGYPFQDLVAGLDFIQEAYPEIDSERMSMLGASYGGFMANWIAGHNDQCGFKALVCHDGVFNTTGTFYTTEELYFPEREFGGVPWEVPENYARWNPQNHIKKWKTPQLIIHGGKDYRLVEGEGLGVFNTLQRLGVPSRFVYFASENHWVLEPHNSRRWHEEVFKWIDHWTSAE